MEAYTLEQAEEDVAELRQLVHQMTEILQLEDSSQPNTPSGGPAIYSLAGIPYYIDDAGLAVAIPGAQTGTSQTTVTASTVQGLSDSFTIPANDANAGTAYRLTWYGQASWGSTVQTLNLFFRFGGASVGDQPSIGSSQFNTSTRIHLWVQMIATCITTGGSATWTTCLSGTASQSANNDLSTTGTNGSIGFCGGSNGTITQDSTAAITMQLGADWASTTGAPSITSRATLWERLEG